MEKNGNSDFTMNGFFLNIINTFFFAISATFVFIGQNLNTITAFISLLFLVLLNARKAAVEVRRWHRIANGKAKLEDETEDKG